MNLTKQGLKIGLLLDEQAPNMTARSGPRTSEADDVLDFRERQAETLTLLDEVEHVQHVCAVDAIARRGAACRRQDASCLIEPQSFPADAAPLGDFTDSHGARVDPAP
jgi:hypothetical protein